MNPRNFWELLREKYSELTRSGRMVADYLTQHAEQAQYLSISALGAACGVAEATIFRFCRSLGFDGYNEMKIALAHRGCLLHPARYRHRYPLQTGGGCLGGCHQRYVGGAGPGGGG